MRKQRSFSPITRRILAVNVFALAVLVIGLMFVGQYRQGLIDSELAAMTAQAELFAGALGEAAVAADNEFDQRLLDENSRQIVRRLSSATGTRARLFRSDGVMVADSRLLQGSGGAVQVENLPPPQAGVGFLRRMLLVFDRTVRLFMGGGAGGAGERILGPTNYPETRLALDGENASAVRPGRAGRKILNVAVPVQRYKKVLGALMLSKGSNAIDEAVFDVRINILEVFGVALAVTVLLSVYLAGTIARPLRRLAEAAENIRGGLGRHTVIPDYAGRRDEIGELSAALYDMTEALWQRMDAIESFAADVAHEIKNPLTSLRSAVETAVRLDDADQQKKLMAIIMEDIDRLDRLITDISSASRLDAELSRAEMKPVDVGGMLRVLVDLYSDADEPDKARLVLNGASGSELAVDGLEDRLAQVFRNLINNAVSFSPPGGVITITAVRKEEPEGNFIEITVDDEGPGFPDGMEDAIFERFYRERPREEKFATHSGLGLSISKQIVEVHGGAISAETRRTEDGARLGARIFIRLPERT